MESKMKTKEHVSLHSLNDMIESYGLRWEEMSILSHELNLDKMAIISKAGVYNRSCLEAILDRFQLDLLHFQSGKPVYWVLNKLNEQGVRMLAEKELGGKKPLYVLFLITSSQNAKNPSGLDEAQNDFEDISRFQCEGKWKPEVMTEYYRDFIENESGSWEKIPFCKSDMTSIGTKPKKTVAFVIKRLWLAKEFIDRSKFINLFDMHSSDPKITNEKWKPSNSLAYRNSHSCIKLKQKHSLEENSEWLSVENADDWRNCIIAELEYPYLVKVRHRDEA